MTEHPVREVLHEVGELEREALPPSPALPPLAIPEIASGKIFLFLLAFYLTAIFVRVVWIGGPTFISTLRHISEPGYRVEPSGSILFGFFFYMCVACTFFPIPTLPPIAFAAKVFDPLLIAVLGTAGTCIANLNDYAILGWMFRHHKIRKIRDAKTYRKLLEYFDRYAFLTLSVATFLPIPIDVVRLLAISRAYPFVKYVLATFTGRLPRYLILAYLGRELPAKYILVLFVVTILPAGYKLASDMIKKRKRE